MQLDEFAKKFNEDPKKLQPLDHAATLAAGFGRFGTMNANIQRYETTAERAYYRAIREIARLQKARKQEEIRSVRQNQLAEPPAVATPPAPAKPIRSVQKNPREYTQSDLELANANMSNAEFDALLDVITAPPTRSTPPETAK